MRRLFVAVGIVLLLSSTLASSRANAVSCDGPTLVVYHFNEGSGSIADNECVMGLDSRAGAISGSFGWVSGAKGKAVHFDSSGQMLANNIPSASPSLTVEFWIRRDSATNNAVIMEKADAFPGAPEWAFRFNSGQVEVETWAPSGSGTTVQSATILPADSWHHIAVTYDDVLDFQTLWIDCVSVGTVINSGGLRATGSFLKIGSGMGAAVDEVRISNTNRTSELNAGYECAPAALSTFGDGSAGAQTFSSSTQFGVIDSSAVGIQGARELTASNGLFAAGQRILIHQTRGPSAGDWELNQIDSYDSGAGTITTVNKLTHGYTTSGSAAAQVLVLRQYSDVTVSPGVTLTAKPWNGTTGGVLAFLVSGTLTVDGTLEANGRNGTFSETVSLPGATGGGFRGGDSSVASPQYTGGQAQSGEGTIGPATPQQSPNGNGGGGAKTNAQSAGWPGGGGGNGSSGQDGITTVGQGDRGFGAPTAGSSDLAMMVFGGGGGGGANDGNNYPGYEGAGSGGSGGGIIYLAAKTINVNSTTGSIVANGGNGGNAEPDYGGGGAGAGGSVMLRTGMATLATNRVTALGGTGGTIGSPYNVQDGGSGGVGRIRVEYCAGVTGSTTPGASTDTVVDGANGDPDADALSNANEGSIGTNPCVNDTDDDGCADGEESAIVNTNPMTGGQRDPLFQWDFYDVNGSKKVDAIDIAVVRSKFNLTTADPDYVQQDDRSVGAHPWAPGAPNGKIDAVDIALVRAEFNHSCIAPP